MNVTNIIIIKLFSIEFRIYIFRASSRLKKIKRNEKKS